MINQAVDIQIRGERPDIIFLCETKATDSKMKVVMEKLRFSNRVVFDAKGAAGGLTMMWKSNCIINVLEYNKNLIAVKVSDPMSDWVLVGFYGPSYASKKDKAWMNLSAFLESVQCPWVCFGDFNYTLSQEDKKGGSSSAPLATNHLRELMFDFSAVDLGFSGNKFTWAKGKWGSAVIKRRLDRGIASMAWRLAFLKACISHLGAFCSDHTPLILDTCPKETFAHRPFQFETAWIRDPSCYFVIDSAWNEEVRGSHFTKLCKKQEATRKALRKRNKEVFGLCQTRINSLIHKIAKTQKAKPSDWNGNTKAALQAN
nr:hypothetical protein CFP56_39540 [Quercus suber]